MQRRRTLRSKIEERIARKKGDTVFLTREFTDLSDEDQVLRALRTLVREGRLVRLGYGVYGRAIKSRLSGEALLYSPGGTPRRGQGGDEQARRQMGADGFRTRLQRGPFNTSPRQSGRACERALLAPTEG